MTRLLLSCLLLCCGFIVAAQQKIDAKKMQYVYTSKPNTIIYNDTLYQGAKQFKQLFINTHDPNIIHLYYAQQQNKIWGNVLSAIGSVGLIVGVQMASSSHNANVNTGWLLVGSGFVTAMGGGYLIALGKAQLQQATLLFNKRIAAKPYATIAPTQHGLGCVVHL
jgi:hypothetical protein